MEQADRIKISRQIVMIPELNAQADALKVQAQASVVGAISIDDTNKGLITPFEPALNGYQLELDRLDGNSRVVIDESKIQDGGDKKQGNVFFPALETGHSPLPVWGQAWTLMFPCLMGGNLGKLNDQTYTQMALNGNERDLISSFNTKVGEFESYFPAGRCTGTKWDETALPSPKPVEDLLLKAKLTEIIALINDYKTLIDLEISSIYVDDTDLVKKNESIAAKNAAIAFKPFLETWLGYADYGSFNPPAEPTTQSGFETYNVSLFTGANKSKGHPDYLNALKTAISNRNTFRNTRIGELNSYLGDVVQDLGSGAITTQTGLYGKRALFLVLRLHLLTGSLFKVKSLQMAVSAQDSTMAANSAGGDAYLTLMKVSKFKAPSMGLNMIHVLDSAGFSVGDSVYVCGDDQLELSGNIVGISGTRIDLSFVVPQKYTPNNRSRIYKVL